MSWGNMSRKHLNSSCTNKQVHFAKLGQFCSKLTLTLLILNKRHKYLFSIDQIQLVSRKYKLTARQMRVNLMVPLTKNYLSTVSISRRAPLFFIIVIHFHFAQSPLLPTTHPWHDVLTHFPLPHSPLFSPQTPIPTPWHEVLYPPLELYTPCQICHHWYFV